MRPERLPRPSGIRLPAVVRVLVALLLAAPLAAHAGAIRDNLYGVKVLGRDDAWAVGNFGSIYHTTDGGRSWEAHDSGTKAPLFGVDFADARHGWAVGKSALVLATQDGGQTWALQKTPIPPEKHLFNVHALDARTAWAIGDWGAIASTRDGGTTWEDHSLGDDVVLYDLSFPDPQHGFIVGEFGTLLASEDGGATWEKRDVGTDQTLFGVTFTTPQAGWAVGIDGLILRTTDGGHKWALQHGRARAEALEDLGFLETLKNPGLYTVQVAGRYGVVAGDTGVLLTTADGGETWTQRPLPERQKLVWMRAASMTPGGQALVVGAGGFSIAIDQDKLIDRADKPADKVASSDKRRPTPPAS
jgi:photosystem II stability/assembly factor-like uncharacterized protein